MTSRPALGSFRLPALLLVAVLLGAGCPGPGPEAEPSPSPTPSPSPSPSPLPEPGPGACADRTTGGPIVIIRAREFEFRPVCVVVLGGHRVRVRNVGTALHNFSIEEEDGTVILDQDVPAGRSFTSDPVGEALHAPGTWTYFCKYHRASGMEGEIEVVAAG